ncbi:MAG: hypothetical protein QM676_15395 [Novosphingobium sp.]
MAQAIALLLFIAGSAPALAQNADADADAKARDMVDRARTSYGPMTPEQARKACRSQTKEGEIVVCAPGDDKEFRVQSSSQLDPGSRQSTRTGVPRAPQLDKGSCKGTGRIGCIGIGGKGHEIYMIDLTSIPATPEGSDAEKVAKGEMSDR